MQKKHTKATLRGIVIALEDDVRLRRALAVTQIQVNKRLKYGRF